MSQGHRPIPPPLPASRRPGPPPLPVPGKAGQSAASRRTMPPPPPPAQNKAINPPPQVKEVKVPPYSELTVDNLVKAFTLAHLKQAVSLLQGGKEGQFFSRPFTRSNVPGALIIHNGKRPMLVIGDLHGNEARLELILKEFGPQIAAEKLEIGFLGDVIHPENSSRMQSMASSLRVLKALITFSSLYPGQVHLVLGDHDIAFTRPEILKAVVDFVFARPGGSVPDLVNHILQNVNIEESDRAMFVGKERENSDGEKEMVQQGLVFLRELCEELKASGKNKEEVISMVSEYQAFFDNCPLAMIIQGEAEATCLMHSVPKKKGEMVISAEGKLETKGAGVTREDLIEARGNGLMHQILMNKKSKGHFDSEDVIANIRALGITADPNKTYMITAHEKLDKRWALLTGPNHCLIHGNVESHFGAVIIENGYPRMIDLRVIATPAQAAA